MLITVLQDRLSCAGTVEVISPPSFKDSTSIAAHTANCMSIKFDPLGKFVRIMHADHADKTRRRFATGGHDSLVCVWDVEEVVCTHTFSAVEYPIRGLSFSYDGELIAIASEDKEIGIVCLSSAPIPS